MSCYIMLFYVMYCVMLYYASDRSSRTPRTMLSSSNKAANSVKPQLIEEACRPIDRSSPLRIEELIRVIETPENEIGYLFVILNCRFHGI